MIYVNKRTNYQINTNDNIVGKDWELLKASNQPDVDLKENANKDKKSKRGKK